MMKVLVLCVLALLALVYAEQLKSKRMLVLLDSNNIKNTHSQFFKSLTDRGYSIEYKLASDSNNVLTQYGEYLYDDVLILAPTSDEIGGSISASSLLEFVDEGHNLVVVAGKSLSEPLREVASECGVQFEDDSTSVIDHFNYDSKLDSGKHTVILSNNFAKQKVIAGSLSSSVIFKGLGMTLNEDNKLLIPILKGAATAYSYAPGEEIENKPGAIGQDTVLVGALQARNGARVTFVGSLDMLSNSFFDADATTRSGVSGKSGNKQFAEELTKWALQERGILRHRSVHHHLVNETQTSSTYKITDDITYSVIIEEWREGKWAPFVADDVQMEFIMIDPYYRVFLKADKNGKFSTTFKVQDTYGIFQFKVDYRRVGYSNLIFSDQVAIRPLNINEYERFIPAAYPYYTGAFSTMAAFVLFGFLFLYTRD